MLTLNNLKIAKNARALASISTLVLLGVSVANAQSAPDAGSLLQQIEKDMKPQLPPKSAPQFLPSPAMQSLGGDTVEVKRFKFAGNTLLTDIQLEQVVANFLNRPIDFATLQNVAVQVAAAYRQAGWVVRAYVPQQEIHDGVITIQIIEAVLGAVHIEGESWRISEGQLKSLVESAQKPGTPLNGDALDRALLLIDDLPGASVTGRLSEGQNQGETDLVLKMTDGLLFSGSVTMDNTGSRSTGSERVSVNVSINSPLRIGDQAVANFLHTEGSDYVRASYSLPVGSEGWRAGVNASHLAYRVVTNESAALGVEGTSTSLGLEANYPLLRTRLKNLYFALAFDQKDFDNRDVTGPTTRYKTQVASLGLNGNSFDNLGGGGSNAVNIAYVLGNVDLAGSPNELVDAVSTQTAGSFNKLRFGASRQQVLTSTVSLSAGISGQLANKNLDSSEKFYLGGASGVRAYPSSEGGGSEGYLLSLEVRKQLPENFTVNGFYDLGSVQVYKNIPVGLTTPLNNYDLRGVGVSLGWTTPQGLNLKATLARRIGENPNPTVTGNDQDGSLNQNRLWLQANLPL